jgi:hypothetical protein
MALIICFASIGTCIAFYGVYAPPTSPSFSSQRVLHRCAGLMRTSAPSDAPYAAQVDSQRLLRRPAYVPLPASRPEPIPRSYSPRIQGGEAPGRAITLSVGSQRVPEVHGLNAVGFAGVQARSWCTSSTPTWRIGPRQEQRSTTAPSPSPSTPRNPLRCPRLHPPES